MKNSLWANPGAVLLACWTGCVLAACAASSQSSPATTHATDAKHDQHWAEADAVWTKYIQHLKNAEGSLAAELAAEPGLHPFGRYRVAALFVDRDPLLRMRPEDVLLVLALRALAPASELEAMNARDVFVVLANAGVLSAEFDPNARIGHQDGEKLYFRSGDSWLSSASLLMTEDGPRVHSANVQSEDRWLIRRRLGLRVKDVPTVPPEDLLNEAARLLKRSPDPAWWKALQPIPEMVRQEAREKLAKLDAPPPAKKAPREVPASTSKEPTERPKPRLEPSVIQAEIRAHFDPIHVCYEDGLARRPDLDGKVIVRFVIERDGRVPVAQRSSDFPFDDVADCIAVQFLTMQFPEPDGGIVAITYPIRFSPG